jgi:hypothetical protein
MAALAEIRFSDTLLFLRSRICVSLVLSPNVYPGTERIDGSRTNGSSFRFLVIRREPPPSADVASSKRTG